MTKKTAKRFLSQNSWKIAAAKNMQLRLSPSMQKQIKEATRTLLQEK